MSNELALSTEWCWYHIIVTTYGAWLHGDSRGFRTRHHREHVEGDYKQPPPVGMYRREERSSLRSLHGRPVRLSPELRKRIGEALIERLVGIGANVIAIAVARQHAHMLAKMPRGYARKWTSLSKKHAWFAAKQCGWDRKLWGKRSKAVLIRTRAHQIRTFYYIMQHADEGAWVWSIRDQAT